MDEEILEQLDIQDLENALEEIEESREEETFRNWVCTILILTFVIVKFKIFEFPEGQYVEESTRF